MGEMMNIKPIWLMMIILLMTSIGFDSYSTMIGLDNIPGMYERNLIMRFSIDNFGHMLTYFMSVIFVGIVYYLWLLLCIPVQAEHIRTSGFYLLFPLFAWTMIEFIISFINMYHIIIILYLL